MASFTSVLKKIGTVVVEGAQIATQVMGFPFLTQLLGQLKSGPAITTAANTVTTDLNTIAGIISMAEIMFPAENGTQTGAQKLAAATPAVQQALMTWAQSNLPGHSSVKNSALLNKAAGEIAGGFADLLNSFGA